MVVERENYIRNIKRNGQPFGEGQILRTFDCKNITIGL